MIEIPAGVEVAVHEKQLTVKGKNGEVVRMLSPLVVVTVSGRSVDIQGKSKALINTTEAHLRNMIKGVQDGFKITMKLIFAHFPISIEVKNTDITIKNFLGEKQARKAKLVGKTKLEVKAKEQLVILSGADKEAVGGSYSNLRTAMKIKEKDGRVFQDGVYIIE